jgi:fatty acid-binding protein DegV
VIGICTDSNSQMPESLRVRFGVEVVPVTITVDGVDYLERDEVDTDAFFAHFADGHTPEVTTSQPSPGQFAAAYEALIDRGCTSILSIHVASSVSGTTNSARLASRALPVPIRIIDSGTVSFGVSCCVWAAAEALEAGATLDEAAKVAERVAGQVGTVFITGGLDLLRASQHTKLLDDARASDAPDGEPAGVPILTFRDGVVHVVARVESMLDAVNAMAHEAIRFADRVNIAVGVADAAMMPLGDMLAEAVGESANVRDVIRYRVGPSVAAQTGPGTVGCFMFPVDSAEVLHIIDE